MRRLFAVLAVVFIAALVGSPATAMEFRYILFDGANTDSTEQASRWIPVRGASRVMIRTWSEHAAFSANNADSLYSDTLTTFIAVFSDSAVVTGGGLTAGADSVRIVGATASNTDTAHVHAGLSYPPLQEQLRGPANGWGLKSYVWPTSAGPAAGSGTLLNYDPRGIIPYQYMRIRCTPLRRGRSTESGQFTEGSLRVNGLKGFHMEAYVYFPDGR